MRVVVILLSVHLAMGAQTQGVQGGHTGYHREVGIPLATRIKKAEDHIFTVEPNAKSAKIIGGRIAPLNEHPYLAGLVIQLSYTTDPSVCGSSLVSATRLVTAAHCWMGASSFEVVLGSQYLFYGGHRMVTNNVVTHPKYVDEFSGFDNDIAVIYLPQAVEFSDVIRPIRLPKSYKEVEQIGEWAEASGYGFTNDFHRVVSDKMHARHVFLRIIPEEYCEYLVTYHRPGTHICTDGTGGVGTCKGDSGGPLVVKRNGGKILVGITSYGPNACTAGEPSGFIRVASVNNFIKQHL